MSRPRPETISLFLVDVDGTLVTKEKVLTERAQAAAMRMVERGIRLALTSGRPPRGMAMLVEPLQLDGPIAGFNGGQFVNPDLTIIESHTLPIDAAKKAAETIRAQGLDLWVYQGEDWLVENEQAPHVDREAWTVKFKPKLVSDVTAHLDGAVKLVGISDDHDLVARAEKAAHEALGDTATAARSQPYYLDVTHHDANKGAVVAYLAKRYGIPAAAIATIGDMPNDVLMFKPSGFSIAMGNSSDEVKHEADAVTDGYEDEGFAKAVEKFILQESA